MPMIRLPKPCSVAVGALLLWLGIAPQLMAARSQLPNTVKSNPGARVVTVGGVEAPDVRLVPEWSGNLGRFKVVNQGTTPVRIQEVVLFDLPHDLPETTPVYGEGFQMLSQTSGTLGKPTDVGTYTDRDHYKLPERAGFRTVYGVLMISPKDEPRLLFGFMSCRRFNGKFLFNGQQLQAVVETDGLELAPGKSWDLEELIVLTHPNRERLYELFTQGIARNHPRLKHDPVPTGWCSWYCFGPKVTASNITENLEWIAKNLPELRYIQIDDGYQPWMGDWLETGKAFGGGVQQVLKEIRTRKFEPALWLAPFVASEQSRLFQEHPDWFVKDDQGKPLRSDKVGFGGWRLGPWYALDGTHPEALKWLETLFRTLRTEWGVTYFKLDATYWGALHGGHRHDTNATRIEAYRRGMEAIRRGAGDALIMGCNHPIWPSLGLIHASRSSLDIERNWESFKNIGRENLFRGWQNGRLWWNDPDCIVLHDGGSQDVMDAGGKPTTVGKVPDNEYQFHATLIYATGGMLLSGDDLTRITPRRAEMLRKMLPPNGACSRFVSEDFSMGVTPLKGRDMVSVYNWTDEPVKRVIPLQKKARIKDFWTGEDLGEHTGSFVIESLPGRSARLFELVTVR